MADDQDTVAAPEGDGDAAEPIDLGRWSNLWQMPVMLISAVLIGAGLYVAGLQAPDEDWDAELQQVGEMIATDQLDAARTRLKSVIEPNLDRAAPRQVARFHRHVADYVWRVQDLSDGRATANDEAIVEHYGHAAEGGDELHPGHLYKWGEALVALGKLDAARNRLVELEAYTVTETFGEEAHRRRNDLLRLLVEESLRRPGTSHEQMLAILKEYREDPMLEARDEAWAVAKQVAFLLEAGEAEEAVEAMLWAMRSFEDASPPLDRNTWGELYTLLAQGYEQQGRLADASWYLDEAFARLEPATPARADARLTQARIAFARDEIAEAYEAYDEVVRMAPGPEHALPGLLGRAQTQSILGDHDAGLADFNALIERLHEDGPRRGAERDRVVDALVQRHGAVLVTGDLDLGLRYLDLAESVFDQPDVVRSDVLELLAATSRQKADDTMAVALHALGPEATEDDVAPRIRHEADEHYMKAAKYFARHAAGMLTSTEDPEAWGRSMRMSGDSYDRAGRPDLATEQYVQYIGWEASKQAPYVAEITFKLAEALEAQGRVEEAVTYYRDVLENHPRSLEGTRSYVPLARCYALLDQVSDAETLLLDVVQGRLDPEQLRFLQPDAPDAIDAQVELGKLYYDEERWAEAVEQLDLAATRLADAPRSTEIRYRLADAHRRLAHELRDRIDSETLLSPTARQQLEESVRTHLGRAKDGFARVCSDYAGRENWRLNRMQRQFRRNAWLNRARATFELGDYREAATLYDRAAQQFGDHHEALEALVQIVNCYDRLGNQVEADVAHRKALARLRQLPDEAFEEPGAMMSREVWEDWLRNRPLGPVANANSDG